jgi:ABC-type bacteriocin/lantibiotic exporter with double-glycine peptidase domain
VLKVPHVPQTNPQGRNSCVPACASMVLSYQGVTHGEQELNDWLATEPAGTGVWNLLLLEERVAGCQVDLDSASFATLQESLTAGVPPIAFVATRHLSSWDRDTIHAVVVVEMSDHEVHVHDPAFSDAPRALSRREFALAWSELDFLTAVITVARGPD